MVAPANRFKRSHRCPVCGGHEDAPRGQGDAGDRCTGFISDDGRYAQCSHGRYAGGLDFNESSGTYGHRLDGPCRCGVAHHTQTAPLTIVAAPDVRKTGQHMRTPEYPKIITTYDYTDEHGDLLYQQVRREGKNFLQRKPDGAGGWMWHIGDARRVLYRLPDLIAADPKRAVFVLEGEKDVDRAVSMGLVATCNPHGAGKWKPDYNDFFRGRNVIVVADVDSEEQRHAGQKHAKRVVAELTSIAATVRYLELPQHDFSDWADAGGTIEQLRALCEPPKPRPSERYGFEPQTLATLMATEYPPLLWIVPELIPEGCTLFLGSPKVGKSITLVAMLLAIASGGAVFGAIKVQQADVLYLALEDGPRRVQRRVKTILGEQKIPSGFHVVFRSKNLAEDLLGGIARYLDDHPSIKLVVIDTLARVRKRGPEKKGGYQDDYDELQPFSELAQERRIGIVVVHHTRKMHSDDPMDMVNGTQGMGGSVDGVCVLARARFGADATLQVLGRDYEEEHQMALQWDKDISGYRYMGPAAEVTKSKERQGIIQAIRAAGTALGISELMERTDYTAGPLRKILHDMVEDGELMRPDRGKYWISSKMRHPGNNGNNGPSPEGPNVTAPEEAGNNGNNRADLASNVTHVTGSRDVPVTSATASHQRGTPPQKPNVTDVTHLQPGTGYGADNAQPF